MQNPTSFYATLRANNSTEVSPLKAPRSATNYENLLRVIARMFQAFDNKVNKSS